ncbi:hypothetical protein H6A64_13325 [Lacrimispora saccharolytica]|nr:hypothetical protein [Lacrimispora saccharolytica]
MSINRSKKETQISEAVKQPTLLDKAELYQQLCSVIEKNQRTGTKAYISIAVSLSRIYQDKLYKEENYANIYDFAFEKFGLSKTNVFNYLSIVKNFGMKEGQREEIKGLKPEYESFSSSQLIAMTKLDEDVRKEIKPNMSVREINRKRRYWEEKHALDSGKNDVAISNKRHKKEKIELIKTKDVQEILEGTIWLHKIEEQEERHPGRQFDVVVSLVFKG